MRISKLEARKDKLLSIVTKLDDRLISK